MAGEAQNLRRVVEDQSQQVAALRQHAERMEHEAEVAKEQARGLSAGLPAWFLEAGPPAHTHACTHARTHAK